MDREKKRHLLVVEDSARLRRSLRMALSHLGHEVDEAADGMSALTLARTRSYDVIMLDLHIPVLDGISFLERHRREHLAGRVLIMSARESDADRRRCHELGAEHYISKPFALDELTAHVEQLS